MSTETAPEKHHFEAEVQQLLNIVINSLYTDKEIFVRELVSNASDALEKLRHLQLTEKDIFEGEHPLEIRITTDEEAKTVTIEDFGIGMTREELTENLGTIAHSGTKAFLQALEEQGKAKDGANVIGQFGVGFYSAFMVAKTVRVYTHSWKTGADHLCWTSDGATGYEITEVDGQHRGSKVVIELKEEFDEFAKKESIERLLKTYSNFVPFPIMLGEDRVNTVEAIWLKNKSEVTDDQYTEFYKFQGKAFDEPRYRMHFSTDAPIAINSLVFVGTENQEKFGFGQMEPGVALYCRNVLIDPHPKGLLPEWLRFLKGVIDSEDLPLNISRESMQDSALVQKLNRLITKRFLKFLEGEMKDNTEKYDEFFGQFSRFIKEGIAMDHEHRESLARLLRFESSMTEKGKLTGLGEYLDRAKEGQEEVYFLIGQNRASIESGPYLEAFKARNLEVIFLYEPIDEYVTSVLTEFKGKKLVPIDRAGVKLDEVETPEDGNEVEKLDEETSEDLCKWLAEVLSEKVEDVKVGSRLVESPAVALNSEAALSPQMRQMMAAMNQDAGAMSKVHLEINPKHELIRNLARAKGQDEGTAKLVAAQILDNALMDAGLLDDPKDMVKRVYQLLGKVVE